MENRVCFERRWFMCDYARQRSFVREEFSLLLDGLARLGYNGVGLYLEGAFAFASIPGVIREGVMTKDDAKWAVEEGKKRGIFVFPMTNVVGHMEHFFWQERFRDLCGKNPNLMEMNFLDERAEAFAMQIVREYIDAFGTTFMHIGGDEVELTEETKIPYAKFLAKICKNLLDKGITPAIWNDMIWMDQPLCEYFDRRVAIFDWNYYGHRPESPKFFRELGFETVLACPCDNSWENFICHQHAEGYLGARKDMPVKSFEVEAMFEDAKNASVYNGFFTHWENTYGANLWGQWTAFARGGLYMSGKLSEREVNDELIEERLFGRQTPYSAVTHILQDEAPYDPFFGMMRNALYKPEAFRKLYSCLHELDGVRKIDFYAAAQKAEDLLLTWKPEGAFEENCYRSMLAICDMMRASRTLLAAFDTTKAYNEAAKRQFEDKAFALSVLDEMQKAYDDAIRAIKKYAQTHERAIAKTGHTRNDLALLSETVEILNRIKALLSGVGNAVDRIPFPRFERLLDRATVGKFIIT